MSGARISETSDKQNKGKKGEKDESENTPTPASPATPAVAKGKTRSSSQQGKKDIMLKSSSKEPKESVSPSIEGILKMFEKKLSNMVSQEYLETQFRKIGDTLVKRLEIVNKEIQEQIKSEVDTIHKDIKELRTEVGKMKETKEEEQTKLSDLETNVEQRNIDQG